MSNTGRHYIKTKEGRVFCVEPIDNSQGKGKQKWGDIDPATKKITGKYGDKAVGAIHEDDSIITEENGFKNITMVSRGNPYDVIDKLIKDGK